jgi:hypothetical protein
MVDGPLGRIVWRVIDAADYWLMQARLGRVDAVRGPVPPTVADEMRKAERERLRKAFPEIVPQSNTKAMATDKDAR